MPLERRKSTDEVSSNFVDSPKHLPKRQKYGITLSDAGLIEGYLQKKICVLIHIRGIKEELVVLFQREGNAGNASPLIANPLITHSGKAVDASNSAPRRDEHIVLVNSVEAMEPPEGVIPSLVRVDVPDRIYGLLPHSLYLSVKSGFVFRGNRSMVENREFGLGGRGLIVPEDESAGEVVESGSEVLDSISRA